MNKYSLFNVRFSVRLWGLGGEQDGRRDTVLPRTYTPELDDGMQSCVLSTDGSGGSVAMRIGGRPPTSSLGSLGSQPGE